MPRSNAVTNALETAWQSAISAFIKGDVGDAARLLSQHNSLAPLLPIARSKAPLVIAQLGQSLDGRIAAPDGSSTYINGPEALDHLHRLRGLVDAVLIGAETAWQDNPSLTVRRIAGPNPARVVIDPSARLPQSLKIFSDGKAPTFKVVGQDAIVSSANDLPVAVDKAGHIHPAAILDLLGRNGLKRLLVEGGARTIGQFLEAGLIDRLHLLVGPVLLGAGRTGIDLKSINSLDQALRPAVGVYRLGEDTLFDCDLSGLPGQANTS